MDELNGDISIYISVFSYPTRTTAVVTADQLFRHVRLPVHIFVALAEVTGRGHTLARFEHWNYTEIRL